VLVEGTRVRISVELLDARSDRHLWADSYEQPLQDVLTLQREIARAVVAQIRTRVAGGQRDAMPPAAKVHPEAYELFLRGELSTAQGNPSGVDRGVDYYQRAIALDPQFAPAHAGLAEALFAQEFWGMAPLRGNVDKVRASTATALSLDPDLADGHVMNARIRFNYDWDWAGTEASLVRAIDLAPGLAFAYETYCWLLLTQGRRDEALAAARKAMTLDPKSAYMVFTEGRVLHRVRQYKAAEAAYRRALELDPGFPMPYSTLAILYSTERRFAEAREILDRRDRLPSARPGHGLRAVLEAATGNAARALEQLGSIGPNERLRVHLTLGNHDEAFAELNDGIDRRTFVPPQLTDPEFDAVRSDPRFESAIKRMGLSPAPLFVWGRWPDKR
jgi:tetratricopeptide (TPR) repeat protein